MSMILRRTVIFSLNITRQQRHFVKHINSIKTLLYQPLKPLQFHRTLSSSNMHQPSETADCDDTIESHARQIFKEAVRSVLPREMIERKLKYVRGTDTLYVDGKEFKLKKNVYVVGFGKAVSGMARVVDDMLSDHITRGIISVPRGSQENLKMNNRHDMCVSPGSKIEVYEGAHNNRPDEDAYATATKIHQLVLSLGEDDLLIVLVSGGGSALLPMPHPPITLRDETEVIYQLASRGATIQELNTIRSNIEILKGGGLADIAAPASVVSLILSDVIRDPINFIASGPTFQCATHPSQCFHLFKVYDIMDKVPVTVIKYLEKKMKTAKKTPESVDDPEFEPTHWMSVKNIIVGNNSIATSAAASAASDLGYLPYNLTKSLEGDTRQAASMFGKLANYILLVFRRNTNQYNSMLTMLEVDLIRFGISKDSLNKVVTLVERCKNMQKSVCVIAGGETTTVVKGQGLGGRNQEMALAIAPLLTSIQGHSEFRTETEICFLSAGTDGADGPTDAAGAVVNIHFAASVKEEGRSLEQFLDNNDSYNLFRLVNGGANHIITGQTGTNVMDMQILIVKP